MAMAEVVFSRKSCGTYENTVYTGLFLSTVSRTIHWVELESLLS